MRVQVPCGSPPVQAPFNRVASFPEGSSAACASASFPGRISNPGSPEGNHPRSLFGFGCSPMTSMHGSETGMLSQASLQIWWLMILAGVVWQGPLVARMDLHRLVMALKLLLRQLLTVPPEEDKLQLNCDCAGKKCKVFMHARWEGAAVPGRWKSRVMTSVSACGSSRSWRAWPLPGLGAG